MNRQPDRTEDAYRAALGVMVEDTPPAPEWEDLLLPTEPIRSRLATKPRRGWAVALVAAGIVLVLVGGIAISVIAFGGDPDVADEPTATTQAPAPTTTAPAPTTSAPTTVPTTTPAALITAPSYASVPSFTGVVQYYQHDPALGDPGWQATVSVSFAGPMLYEVEVVAEEGEYLFLGGAGKVYRGDGTFTWLNEFEDMPFSVLGGIDHFRHLYYDSDWPSPPWDELCAQDAALLGTEALLGRTVTHVACSTTAADYELWIDEESGLVLRMAGPLSIGDYSPSTAPDGGFTFTELTFEPVVIPEMPEIPIAQTGEFPPFHMIRNEWLGVREYWYRDVDTLRETIIDADDEGWIGTFTVVSNGRLAGCSTHPEDPGDCYDVPLDDASDIYPLGRPYRQVPLSLVEESCTEVSQDSVAGRQARHFVCDGVHFETIPNAGSWYAVPDSGPTSDYWYDTEADLLLQTVGTGNDVAATLLEVNPAFPVGIFEYEELVFPSESDTG